MLNVHNLTKHFGGRTVLDGVTFQLNDRERTALVGANGSGKSTLLKLLLGELEPDMGSIALTPGTRSAYLAQDSQVAPGRTLQHEMESVFEGLDAIVAEQDAVAARMHELPADAPELLLLADRQAHLHEEFERLGGYTVEAEVGRVLSGLGFSDADRFRQTHEFSGGWQMRIALAKLLLQAPDVLLLDEPTNHLDLAAVEWLEEYLKGYRGAVLLVSHDRYVLDRVTTRTLELERGVLHDWAGNYTWFIAEKERQIVDQESAYRRQQTYLDQQRAFIERFRAKSSKAAQVQSREKQLNRIEKIAAPRRSTRTIKFRFPDCPPSGREVLALRKVAKSYGSRRVLANVSMVLERGDRLALVGPNGAGKSTLLKLMAQVETADRGSVLPGHNVTPSYFAQHQADNLDHAQTVLDEVYRAAPPGWTKEDVRSLLGRFLFSDDDVFKKIGVLSGGERSRVALAKMLLRPANLLFLDEPTNHLDIAGREVLERALNDFPGAFVIVSHDRYLLDRVATRIADINDGEVRVYVGNYSDYRAQRAVQTRSAPVELAAPARPSSAEQQATVLPSTRQPAARAPRPSDAAPIALTVVAPSVTERPRRERSARPGRQPDMSPRRLERIEEQIVLLEERKGVMEAELAHPDLYRDADRWPILLADFEEVNRQLDDLNRQWNDLAMREAEQNAEAALAR